jgi:nucleoside-specific outer membrane channel protein Tsx
MQQTRQTSGKSSAAATASRIRNKALVAGMSGSLLALSALTAMQPAKAAEWSDNSIGYRYGTKFAEPYNDQDLTKNIINFTHASGYKYGSNYLNVDLLMSNHKDDDAQEAYIVYRHTLDIGKISGKDFKFGPVRGLGFTGGFDWNTKNDKSYASKKRMLVVGPTLMMDVPGFLNISLFALFESNEPIGVSSRYRYDTHPMLNMAWGIPLGSSAFSFEGYVNWIGAKGKNEFGGPTSPEVNFDGQVMYDLGSQLGMGKNTFKVGLEYQYWRNKFGNPHNVPGSLAKTPMIRAEYHF